MKDQEEEVAARALLKELSRHWTGGIKGNSENLRQGVRPCGSNPCAYSLPIRSPWPYPGTGYEILTSVVLTYILPEALIQSILYI